MKVNRLIFFTLIILASISAGLLIQKQTSFGSLNPKEKQELLVSQRTEAIEEAVKNGDYRCCINPPCTMCYMEANLWNNHTPGTCACDDLIAQGEEACPQCNRGLCESGQENVCEQE